MKLLGALIQLSLISLSLPGKGFGKNQLSVYKVSVLGQQLLDGAGAGHRVLADLEAESAQIEAEKLQRSARAAKRAGKGAGGAGGAGGKGRPRTAEPSQVPSGAAAPVPAPAAAAAAFAPPGAAPSAGWGGACAPAGWAPASAVPAAPSTGWGGAAAPANPPVALGSFAPVAAAQVGWSGAHAAADPAVGQATAPVAAPVGWGAAPVAAPVGWGAAPAAPATAPVAAGWGGACAAAPVSTGVGWGGACAPADPSVAAASATPAAWGGACAPAQPRVVAATPVGWGGACTPAATAAAADAADAAPAGWRPYAPQPRGGGCAPAAAAAPAAFATAAAPLGFASGGASAVSCGSPMVQRDEQVTPPTAANQQLADTATPQAKRRRLPGTLQDARAQAPDAGARCASQATPLPGRAEEDGLRPWANPGPIESPSPLPPALDKALMPFQRAGVAFAVRRGGRLLLGDDMGLGKTIQAIAMCCAFRLDWPVLIVVPNSVRYVWADELERWIPDIGPRGVNVIQSGQDLHGLTQGASFHIATYGILARASPVRDFLREKEMFKMVVVDESHMIKNRAALRTREIMQLLRHAQRVVLLSGTPALARPVESYYCSY